MIRVYLLSLILLATPALAQVGQAPSVDPRMKDITIEKLGVDTVYWQALARTRAEDMARYQAAAAALAQYWEEWTRGDIKKSDAVKEETPE